MAPSTAMILRHAEKPEGATSGVGPDGRPDAASLTVRGWQRAGALARLFWPLPPSEARLPLRRPAALFAAGVGPGSESRRHVETLDPLAALSGLRLNDTFLKGQTEALTAAVLFGNGPALICWEHRAIAELVGRLTAGTIRAPDWPDARFDMAFVLEQQHGSWRLFQEPQLLLAGDSDAPLG